MKIASTQIIRDIEAQVDATIMSYDQMMQNAGRAAGAYLCQELNITHETHITLLIGKGNNGGDGLVVAHYLAQNTEAQVRLYLLEHRPDDDNNYQTVMNDTVLITVASDDHDYRMLRNLIRSADIIIDALFGIGIRLPIRDTPARIMRTVNQALQPEKQFYGDAVAIDPTKPNQLGSSPSPFIFAIDCPSGINCDTGEADHNTIPANMTMTFIAAKYGQLTFPAAQYVGKLIISQIGIPDTQEDIQSLKHFVIDNQAVSSRLPQRPLDGHKGTFGKAFIVAGSENYIGATALAGESAYRSGAGLVTVATTTQNIRIVASQLREPTYVHLPDEDGSIHHSAHEIVREQSKSYDACLVGCGLGQHPTTVEFIKSLFSHELTSLVVDADALNVLSQMENWRTLLPAGTIITPHPGEMARLCNTSASKINANRLQIASEKAREWNLIVVLKGAHTTVASPNGDIGVIPFKSDALGTAGTGDVLAGMIVGLLAQGISPYDSAICGTYIHALAGMLSISTVANSRAVIASDVIQHIGQAFRQVEKS